MLVLLWLRGTIAHRRAHLAGVAAGILLSVALLGSIGSFIGASSAMMTRRAIAGVPVDWQVRLEAGTDAAAATGMLERTAHPAAVATVTYADVAGLRATTAAAGAAAGQATQTTQTTGPGKVLGLPDQYLQQFPAELRLLVGSTNGVLVAQQTAANLHVAPGDVITIQRESLSSVDVQIAGIVELPNADSLFQTVGAAPGAGPQAPPDNVLLLPATQWHQLFDPQSAATPGSTQTQLHVRLAHDLPADPGDAYTLVVQRAHGLEAALAGNGRVGDNLATRLDGVRADALYARLLFLFLGLPGVMLGVLLTLAVAASGADRRRREQLLLRTRGAAIHQVLRIASVEAAAAGLVGVLAGLVAVAAIGRAFVPAGTGPMRTTVPWLAAAAASGIVLAVVAVLYPGWQQLRQTKREYGSSRLRAERPPVWQRLYLDALFLIVAAVVFWLTKRSGYQVVLAPEGAAQSSVAYQAFLAPICFWIGVVLFIMRIYASGLTRGRRLLGVTLRPLAGGLAGTVAAFLGRQQQRLSRGTVLVALAVAFAVSTAVFNTTYNAQARVDARLTNGADVTVTGSSAAPAGAALGQLRALPGAAAAQPLQHRFAYVGADLQDIYGIDAAHIGQAAALQNAFFANGDAKATLAALATRTDGVLVSAETANDYQLHPGDQITLRLQNAADHQYHPVMFHFVGVVREFPTAPKDSFLVANAAYITAQTGSAAAEVVLLRANGDPAALAALVRGAMQGSGAMVSDIGAAQSQVGSSLTAVNLSGLTRIELSFALLMAVAATGLILGLSLIERRRAYIVMVALGATRRQLEAFVWSEGFVVLSGGIFTGAILGFAIAQMLVKLLTGVFDPPPQALSVPWLYLAAVLAVTAASVVPAALIARDFIRRSTAAELRTT